MFHTYTVFITQSIVPRPLHYDKYLDLSCKSHTLAQIIINVLHYDIFFKYLYPLFINELLSLFVFYTFTILFYL